MGTHPEDKRGAGGATCASIVSVPGEGAPASSRSGQGHLAAGVGPLGEGAAGVLPPGGALGPVAGRLHRGPEGAQVQIQPDHPDRPRLQCHLGADSAESGGCCAQAHR